MPVVGAAHFEHADVGVVRADVRSRDEREAEQAMRGVERRRQHPVEREIGLQLTVVQLVARLAHLFGVVAPVPGLDRVRRALRLRQRRQRIALRRGPRLRRLPHLAQQPRDGVRRAGHPVGERVFGVVAVAVQARLLVAQREDLAGDRTVVVRAVVLAARRPRLVRLLAQVAPVREREERHDQRT